MRFDLRAWRRSSFEAIKSSSGSLRPQQGGWKDVLIACSLFVLLMLVGFWWGLPERQILQFVRHSVFKSSGVLISAEKMSLTPLLRVTFEKCRIEPVPLAKPLVIEEVRLDPNWMGLLGGNLALDVEMRSWGGKLSGVVSKNGTIDLELVGLELGQVPGLPEPYRLAGKLEAKVAGQLGAGEKMRVEVKAGQLQLAGLDAFGVDESLKLGDFSSQGELQGKSFKIDALEISGGVVEGSGKGSVMLGASPATSRISANLQMRLDASAPGLLKDLISLSGDRPDREGWYHFRINGRLDAPTLK